MQRGMALIVFLAFALSSCTYMNSLLPRSSVKKAKKQKMEIAAKNAQQNIAAGDYEAAINIYRSLLSQYPGDRTVNGKLNETLEAAKDSADSQFRNKDYSGAGEIYSLLENNSPAESRQGIKEKKKLCSKMLMEEGLMEYRQGNLDRALLKWRSVLKFDPENDEVKKAADTASVQLKNLKK